MKAMLAGGFWGTSHFILDSIGRGTTWFFHARVSPHDEEVYSMTGGGTIGAFFGAGIGLIATAQSGGLSPVAGALIGGMVGICTGVFSGAIVQIVDDYIDALASFLNLQRGNGAHYDSILIHRR